MIANIALNEQQFRDLVAGRVVEELGAEGRLKIKIILSDIGFSAMRNAIACAESAQPISDYISDHLKG